MTEKKKFQRQAFINRLMKASSARHSANEILSSIARQMSFEGPTSKITKKQIFEETGLHRRTILRALGELKDLGEITVVENGQGGAGIAPTYQLHIPKEALERATEAKTGKATMTAEERAISADEAMLKAGFRPRKHNG